MAIRKTTPTPNIKMFDPRRNKTQSDVIVLRSAYNTPVPINRKSGYYQFKSHANGAICFEISDLIADYGTFQSRSQAQTFAKNFQLFAKLWLEKRGYSPVTFRIVPQWNTAYGYNDPQGQLREKIWQDFLDPRNFGRRLEDYEGLRSPIIRSFIDTGVKTE